MLFDSNKYYLFQIWLLFAVNKILFRWQLKFLTEKETFYKTQRQIYFYSTQINVIWFKYNFNLRQIEYYSCQIKLIESDKSVIRLREKYTFIHLK